MKKRTKKKERIPNEITVAIVVMVVALPFCLLQSNEIQE